MGSDGDPGLAAQGMMETRFNRVGQGNGGQSDGDPSPAVQGVMETQVQQCRAGEGTE